MKTDAYVDDFPSRRFVQQVFVGPVAACWSDWIDKVPHSQREFDSDTPVVRYKWALIM